MFEGFALDRITVGDVVLRVRYGGTGPPVVLLHGHPRTHATWHRVAPMLAGRFTVVCPDLRGYGQSSTPPTTADHTPYSKRTMAADIIALMHSLGHDRFAVVGHDRGTYVAQRLAMDHPSAVTHLVVLDGVPIGDALGRADARFAQLWWHWFFLGQTTQPAERVITVDPDAWYGGSADQMGVEAYQDYRQAIHDPDTVHAMCEDYRAGLGVDREADDADRRAGRRIAVPVLFGYAGRDDMHVLYDDPAGIWREWATNVTEIHFDCGHHIAEEAPGELATALADFLSG